MVARINNNIASENNVPLNKEGVGFNNTAYLSNDPDFLPVAEYDAPVPSDSDVPGSVAIYGAYEPGSVAIYDADEQGSVAIYDAPVPSDSDVPGSVAIYDAPITSDSDEPEPSIQNTNGLSNNFINWFDELISRVF